MMRLGEAALPETYGTSSGAVSLLIRHAIEMGVGSEAGLSLSLSVKSGRMFGKTSYVYIHSFLGPLANEMIAVHFQGSSTSPKTDFENQIFESDKMLVFSSFEKRERLISTFTQALDVELKHRKVAIEATLRDHESKIESHFSIQFRNYMAAIGTLRSNASKLKWFGVSDSGTKFGGGNG